VDRRWWTLTVASAGTAVLLLDVTVVNVALPAIGHSLDADLEDLQWVIDAYALTLAATLLASGSLADRHGRRLAFTAGAVVFALASLVCGVAESTTVLNVGRALQGIGGAAMFATGLALIAQDFQGRQRGVAFGVWGAVSGAALAIGPLAGGALVDGAGWRWIFIVNIPIGALLAAAALARLRESRDPAAPSTDWPGVAVFSAASFLIVYGLIRGNADGWGSAAIVGALAGGAALAVGFVAIERRSPHPILDPGLFRDRAFSGTALVAFAQSFAIYPLFLFVALYLQEVLGATPLEAGLRLLPVTLALFVIAPLSGRLTGTLPLRVLLAAGLTLIGAGVLLMRAVSPDSDWTALLPGFLVGGAGIGVISPALAAAMIAVVTPERTAFASGVNNTFRQLGIAVGIAALGAIFQGYHVADRAGFVAGLDAVFLVAGLVALAAAPLALTLVREGSPQTPRG
jgi:EmrB/QacA subfamily drug resistance transporter